MVQQKDEKIVELPVMPLRGLVLFPNMMIHFDIGRKKSLTALEEAMNDGQTILFLTQKDIKTEDPSIDELYSIGTVAKVCQILRQPGNTARVLVEGLYRAKIDEVIQQDPFIKANIYKVDKKYVNSQKREALGRKVKEVFSSYLKLCPKMPPDLVYEINAEKDVGKLADKIVSNIILDYSVKQDILNMVDAGKRIECVLDILINELQILSLEESISDKLRERIDKNQKEYYLREQLRLIAEELGEGDIPQLEADEFRQKIKKLNLSEEISNKLFEECDRLSKMAPGSHESNVIRSYLTACIDLPWNKSTDTDFDLDNAEDILNRDHYGLDEVKENILDLLAVRKIKPDIKGQIMCLVGPPGVGKTSIAKSIAEATGRKYVRIALGGVKDESEIRGHRRTYIGSMPGRIMSAIKNVGVNNPLVLLDEVDKLSKDFNGDPTSALLEVLDPEQNNTFQDHYIDLPFDLSKVLFITTANDYSSIPAPLLDRMNVITLTSYTEQEKFEIARRHLIPKQLAEHGITLANISMTNNTLKTLINGYTKEAGVRELERVISTLISKVIRKKLLKENLSSISIYNKDLKDILGPAKYKPNNKETRNKIGVVNGLAWTSVGGEVMPIELALMPGTGKIELTGSLGDVMKESARIAVSYMRSNSYYFDIDNQFYKEYDIHIHAPEGAVPKDGPSAGLAMCVALFSALKKVPVNSDVAMTGEITLMGDVLPIGGLKEKVTAAYNHGIRTVIIPDQNSSDLYKIDDDILDEVKFIRAKTVLDGFKNSFSSSSDQSKYKLKRKETEIHYKNQDEVIMQESDINEI